ncbi:hypothetical protein HKX48_006250 [Thoreauomyces humboldtii]|nr:hypothetical protein HKX48_006250 [Thoreauomyces humboldtii]
MEVVTPPDNPRNKISQVPLKAYASSVGLKTHAAPHKSLKGWEPPSTSVPFDLAVVVSFGYFLPRKLIEGFGSGAVNVHPSLLPKYRGAAPLQYTILNDDREGGVSIIELDPTRFDVGRILKQSKIEVPPKTRYGTLHDQLAEMGASDLLEVIRDMPLHKARPQAEAGASSAPKIPKTMAMVNWNKTADEVHRLDRAIGGKIPLHTIFRDRRTQLLDILDPDTSGAPQTDVASVDLPFGTLRTNADRSILFVRCRDSWLACKTVHVQGKNRVGIRDFDNGYKLRSDDRFETDFKE